ncbi:hypothetical protein MRX96_013014 [Rhipicephalus microplus]
MRNTLEGGGQRTARRASKERRRRTRERRPPSRGDDAACLLEADHETLTRRAHGDDAEPPTARQGERINLISFLPTTTHALLCWPGQVANIPFGRRAACSGVLPPRAPLIFCTPGRPLVLYGEASLLRLSILYLRRRRWFIGRCQNFVPDFSCSFREPRSEHASCAMVCLYSHMLYRPSNGFLVMYVSFVHRGCLQLSPARDCTGCVCTALYAPLISTMKEAPRSTKALGPRGCPQ